MRGDTAEHLQRVLRVAVGHEHELSDGSAVRLGRIERVSRGEVEFSLGEDLPVNASRLRLTLVLSIVKFDRFEWALEKATELGMSEVIPLIAERSERGLAAAAAKRAARWAKILVESAQQSRRLRPPELMAATGLSDFLGKLQSEKAGHAARVWLSEDANAAALRDVMGAFPRETTNVAVLAIGPEGGWTDAENTAAVAAGFLPASLGKLILRTETAVAAAIASINYALGE